MEEKELKHKKIKGRVQVLKANLYKGHMVYIRKIGSDYFEYLLEFNGEIYSSYIIITPREGKTKLSKKEIEECASLIYTGATSTLDVLTDTTDITEKDAKIVEIFEKHRGVIEDQEKQNAKTKE